MSVEGGSSGGGSGGGSSRGTGGGVGAVASVGSGIEGGGLARAASVSGLARFDSGPTFGAAPVVAGPIVNEGPVGLADLKITVPLGKIRFNEPLSVPGVLAEAESIISQAQKPAVSSPVISDLIRDDRKVESSILPQVEPVVAPIAMLGGLEYPKPQVVVSPAAEPITKTENALAVQTGSQSGAESRVSAKVTQAVLAQPVAKEQAAEEVVEEVDTKEAVKTQDLEQIEKVRLGLVEDTPKTRTREDELSQAIELAATEAKVLGVEGIEGWRIVNKLIPQHSGDRSETLNEEDPQNTIPDGSWESVKEDIKTRKFTSVEEARKVTSLINRKYRPEKKGEEDDITEEEHQRVHKDHKHPSRRPLQILERRIVRKEKQASSGQSPEPVMIQEAAQSKQETSLEELNPALAEVFPKH